MAGQPVNAWLRLGIALIGALALTTAVLQPIRRDAITPQTTGYRVDVNHADAQELTLLPGVGPTLARHMVEYRGTHGPITNPAQLDAVPRIGPIIRRRFTPWIVVAPAGPEAGRR